MVPRPWRRLERRVRRLPLENRRAGRRAAGPGRRRQPVRIAVEVREDRPLLQPEHQGAAGRGLEPHAAPRHLRHHHAFVAALRAASLRRPRDRSVGAHADDPRPRRSPARVQRRRSEAAAVDVAHSFPRVLRQQRRRMARRLDRVRRAAHPRPHELQRVDRRAGLHAAARMRRPVRMRRGCSPKAPTPASTIAASR